MIALDFDGVIANYGDHTTRFALNAGLLALLPPPQRRVAICTNQGGMAFHRRNPAKYPHPKHVAQRLSAGARWLHNSGYPVSCIYISAFHPKAGDEDIQYAAQLLRRWLRAFPTPTEWNVYTTAKSRKPSPFMLRVAGATVYYGDSPEDREAAGAAGIEFFQVERFM